MTNKPWHQGSYPRQARALRQAATANPDTRCRRCGLTLEEYARVHGARAARWTAGHVRDSDPTSPLAPEHARCNLSAGATYGNGLRHPRSEDPYR